MDIKQSRQDFLDNVVPDNITYSKTFLDDVIKWMKQNLEPDDVFDDDQLCAWAAATKRPDDVFPEKELSEWAENEGYTKE